MSPTQAVREALAADAPVSAKVGARVYPLKMPKTSVEQPSIVVTTVSTDPLSTFDALAPLASSRVQVDCYARQLVDAHALAELVEDCLDALDDPRPRATKTDSRELFDDELQLHRVSLDFSVWMVR